MVEVEVEPEVAEAFAAALEQGLIVASLCMDMTVEDMASLDTAPQPSFLGTLAFGTLVVIMSNNTNTLLIVVIIRVI